MATWEGARFIGPQLESILSQTRAPDTLLIRDDRSADGTPDLIAEALAGVPFPWHLSVNPVRLGAVGNFSQLLAAAECDIVVLTDQDDLWHPERLSTIEAALTRPGIDAVFHNATLIDGEGHHLGGDLWSSVGFTGRYRRMFGRNPLQLLLNRNVVTGATLAVRRSLLGRALPVGRAAWHDHWLALVAAATGQVFLLDQPLTSYRLHGGNAAGLDAPAMMDKVRARLSRPMALTDDINRYTDLAGHLRGIGAPPHSIQLVDARVHVAMQRARLPRSSAVRAARVLATLPNGDYWRFGSGLRSAAYDILGHSTLTSDQILG